MSQHCLPWLRWVLIPNFGLKRCHELLNYLDSPQALFLHPDRWPLPDSIRQTLKDMNRLGEQHPVHRRALEQLAWAETEQHHLISLEDQAYPDNFQALYDAPLMLWAKGKPELLKSSQVGIVGSRNASPNGIRHTSDISQQLAQSGLTITSGGALGVDAASHQAALKANGNTIAVLGCGLDIVYPKQNQQLFQQIAEQGLLLSEYPLATPPRPGHFPRRNRIISGLSDALIVIEAALASGTLTTAQHAIEQGKDIFALPGDISHANNAGCHRLIQQGAYLLAHVNDVIEHFQLKPSRQHDRNKETSDYPLSPLQQGILECLAAESMPIESLALQLNEPMKNLLEPLLELELAGLLEQHPGGYSLS